MAVFDCTKPSHLCALFFINFDQICLHLIYSTPPPSVPKNKNTDVVSPPSVPKKNTEVIFSQELNTILTINHIQQHYIITKYITLPRLNFLKIQVSKNSRKNVFSSKVIDSRSLIKPLSSFIFPRQNEIQERN